MTDLLAILDTEVQTLEALVRVSQAERQALMTFETVGLRQRVDEKEALLGEEDAVRTSREAWLLARGAETLPEYLATLSEAAAAPIVERRTRIRALLAALSELNQLSLLQATRQLRWVRTRRRTLSGAGGPTYGRRGVEGRGVAGLGLNAVV